MHLSCLPVSFFTDIIAGRMSLAEWAAMGARLGLDAIDLSILLLRDRSSAAVTAARNAIAAEGMRVAMVTSYPDFTYPDPAQRERELAMEQEVVEVAAGLGASLVRVTTGQAHPETRREEGIAWAVDGLAASPRPPATWGHPRHENHSSPAWSTPISLRTPHLLEVARASRRLVSASTLMPATPRPCRGSLLCSTRSSIASSACTLRLGHPRPVCARPRAHRCTYRPLGAWSAPVGMAGSASKRHLIGVRWAWRWRFAMCARRGGRPNENASPHPDYDP